MLTEQSGAYIDSRAVNEHDSEIGFCELELMHVSERFCLKECQKDICFHYPFKLAKKRAVLARAGLYTRKLAWLRQIFGAKCWFCGSSEKLEFAHIKPTALSGQGRGQPQRFYDIVKNADSYCLSCDSCHYKLDAGQLTLEELWK